MKSTWNLLNSVHIECTTLEFRNFLRRRMKLRYHESYSPFEQAMKQILNDFYQQFIVNKDVGGIGKQNQKHEVRTKSCTQTEQNDTNYKPHSEVWGLWVIRHQDWLMVYKAFRCTWRDNKKHVSRLIPFGTKSTRTILYLLSLFLFSFLVLLASKIEIIFKVRNSGQIRWNFLLSNADRGLDNRWQRLPMFLSRQVFQTIYLKDTSSFFFFLWLWH